MPCIQPLSLSQYYFACAFGQAIGAQKGIFLLLGYDGAGNA